MAWGRLGLVATVWWGTLLPGAVTANERWPPEALSRFSSVYVLDTSGEETSGTVARVGPDALVLNVGQLGRRFDVDHIVRIQRRGDSVRNGLLIGALIGGTFGAVGASITDCPDGCPGFRVGVPLFNLALFGLVGAGIDALIPGRTTVYMAPPSRAGRGSRQHAVRPVR